MAWGHKVSTKQSLLAHFLVHFSTEWNENLHGHESVQVEHANMTFE